MSNDHTPSGIVLPWGQRHSLTNNSGAELIVYLSLPTSGTGSDVIEVARLQPGESYDA